MATDLLGRTEEVRNAEHARCSLRVMAQSPEEYREKITKALDNVFCLVEGGLRFERSPCLGVEQYKLSAEVRDQIGTLLDEIERIVMASPALHLPEVLARVTWAAAWKPGARAVVPPPRKSKAPTLRIVPTKGGRHV